MSGYFDDVLHTFKTYGHPFILVGALGMRWNGVELLHHSTIEALVSRRKIRPIAEALLESGQWRSSRSGRSQATDNEVPSSPIQQLRLERVEGAFGPYRMLRYLHLYSEDLYQLPVSSCLGLKVPDLYACTPVTLEHEYDRDPHGRFGPVILEPIIFEPIIFVQGEAESCELIESDTDEYPVLHDVLARSPSTDISIFVPSISAHMNALLRQTQHATTRGTIGGFDPDACLEAFVRDLFLDWAPTARWFLRTKIADENRRNMERILNGFNRSREHFLFDEVLDAFDGGKLPWELPVPREGEGSASEDERSACEVRCGHCQMKGKGQHKSKHATGKWWSANTLQLAEDFGLPIDG